MPNMALMLLQMLAILTETKANAWFTFIFAFRYLRLIVHIVSFYFIYKPTPIPANPTLRPSDVTVIIPTIDPENEGFQECLRSTLKNQPGAILIVTVGKAKVKLVHQVIKPFRKDSPLTSISVAQTEVANKRRQVCHALPQVDTPITVLVDDHVDWPSVNFLPTILAPFEDPTVGGLGTNKVVRRTGSGYGMNSIFNFLGCVYLERHNFEIAATNAIDGGVFVLSGRTAAYRTCILQDQAFIDYFSNEMFFFGKLGPILPDDDNALTRWLVKHGWKLKIQYCHDATIETDLGNPSKYLSQCLRWVRTTWRSNSCSLFTDRTVWRAQPWCVYAVYITSFFNAALFFDASLVFSLWSTTFGSSSWTATYLMAAWIFLSKMVKLIPHFRRWPKDLVLIPVYLIFAYYHSLMKLWALFTFYDCAWGGRNLAAINASAEREDGDGDSSYDDGDGDSSYDDEDGTDDDDGYQPNGRGSYHRLAYGTGSSYHTANSATTSSSRPSPRSGYNGPSYGKQAIVSRYDENDVPAPMQLPSPPQSSSGSSEESASYYISKWTKWEKASHSDKPIPRTQPIPIHCRPTSFPRPHEATPSSSRGYRSPIYTRSRSSGSSSSSYSSSASDNPTHFARCQADCEDGPNHRAPHYFGCHDNARLRGGADGNVKAEYRRRWGRGQDCKRQHDEGMGLMFGQCNLGRSWEEFAL